jgi:hypothetical protein
MKKVILALVLVLAVSAAWYDIITTVCADGPMREVWWQERWCAGQVEVVLADGVRCDCLTDTHAIEIDFARKWYEAIGQALYYGLQTGRRPGVGLIVEKDTDKRYFIRLNSVILHYGLPIDTWEIGSW